MPLAEIALLFVIGSSLQVIAYTPLPKDLWQLLDARFSDWKHLQVILNDEHLNGESLEKVSCFPEILLVRCTSLSASGRHSMNDARFQWNHSIESNLFRIDSIYSIDCKSDALIRHFQLGVCSLNDYNPSIIYYNLLEYWNVCPELFPHLMKDCY